MGTLLRAGYLGKANTTGPYHLSLFSRLFLFFSYISVLKLGISPRWERIETAGPGVDPAVTGRPRLAAAGWGPASEGSTSSNPRFSCG